MRCFARIDVSPASLIESVPDILNLSCLLPVPPASFFLQGMRSCTQQVSVASTLALMHSTWNSHLSHDEDSATHIIRVALFSVGASSLSWMIPL